MTNRIYFKWALIFAFVSLPFLFLHLIPSLTLNSLVSSCLKVEENSNEAKWRFKYCLPRGVQSYDRAAVDERKQGVRITRTTDHIINTLSDSRLSITMESRDGKDGVKGVDRFVEHLSKRYSFGVALFGMLLSSVVVFAYTAYSLSKIQSRKSVIALILISAFIVLMAFGIFSFRSQSVLSIWGVARIVVLDPLNQIEFALGIISPEQQQGFFSFIQSFFWLHYRTFEVFVVSLVCVTAVLASLTMMQPTNDAQELGQNRKNLDFFLTLVAIHFAVFVFYIRQFIQIAYPFVDDVKNAQLLGGAVIQYWAASCSLLLLVVFGIAFVLHQTAAQNAADNTKAGTPRKSLAAREKAAREAGANKSLTDRLIDLLKVLLPIISGVAFELSSLVDL